MSHFWMLMLGSDGGTGVGIDWCPRCGAMRMNTPSNRTRREISIYLVGSGEAAVVYAPPSDASKEPPCRKRDPE